MGLRFYQLVMYFTCIDHFPRIMYFSFLFKYYSMYLVTVDIIVLFLMHYSRAL